MSKVFRSKSVDRISSPEQLNDYVRVSNPGVWMALTAIIVLLIGVCVWGVFGKMDTTVQTVVWVKDGRAVCYVKENDAVKVQLGQTAQMKGIKCMVESIADSPVPVSEDMDAYALHIGSLSVGEWVYEVTFSEPLPDGIYVGKIITQSVTPISFLLN